MPVSNPKTGNWKKNLKPHTIAENLILPACSEIVQIMFGDDAKKEIIKIPLSDDTIKKEFWTYQIRKLLQSSQNSTLLCKSMSLPTLVV